MKKIIKEISLLSDQVSEKEILNAVKLIYKFKNKTIVGIAAGRMGYSMSSFIMRLSHLGFKSYMIGDTTLPRIDKNTLTIINSSSGLTPSILYFSKIAFDSGSKILLFSKNNKNGIYNYSDQVVVLPSIKTKQVMKTVYEQFTFLLFDFLISLIISKYNINENFIIKNHSILE